MLGKYARVVVCLLCNKRGSFRGKVVRFFNEVKVLMWCCIWGVWCIKCTFLLFFFNLKTSEMFFSNHIFAICAIWNIKTYLYFLQTTQTFFSASYINENQLQSFSLILWFFYRHASQPPFTYRYDLNNIKKSQSLSLCLCVWIVAAPKGPWSVVLSFSVSVQSSFVSVCCVWLMRCRRRRCMRRKNMLWGRIAKFMSITERCRWFLLVACHDLGQRWWGRCWMHIPMSG